jgi:hypothetical protein
MAESMRLVVRLEEEQRPSCDLAVAKIGRRHPDDFSLHELAGAEHFGNAIKFFRPKQR